uniref:SprT-like domain-containing protein n=1 Tax=Panagrolaimus sp. ES5 TaxID=591445 RepID=A0AC34F6V7_9BILA
MIHMFEKSANAGRWAVYDDAEFKKLPGYKKNTADLTILCSEFTGNQLSWNMNIRSTVLCKSHMENLRVLISTVVHEVAHEAEYLVYKIFTTW